MANLIRKSVSKKYLYPLVIILLVLCTAYCVMLSIDALKMSINIDDNTYMFSRELDAKDINTYDFNSDGTTKVVLTSGETLTETGVRLSLVRAFDPDKAYWVSESKTIVKGVSVVDIVSLFISRSYIIVFATAVALLFLSKPNLKDSELKRDRVLLILLYINALFVLEVGVAFVTLLKK